MSAEISAALLVGTGLALLLVGLLSRVRQRQENLAAILDLPYGEHDVPIESVTEVSALVRDTLGLAGRMVDQVDPRGALLAKLERARVPMRPAEFVLLVTGAGLLAGLFLWTVTTQWILGAAALLTAPFAGSAYLNLKVSRRRKAFEAQLPEALALIASSLSAGHTFLRAMQMMCEEAPPPLADEFARVVHETRLGAPLVDALERMATRLEIPDLAWVVQAIRIQQSAGGKLADLLYTLTDFMRAREEIRREVSVLTAEGRISAWVLGGLPVFLLVVIQSISPGYMTPLFRGAGYLVLGVTALSVAAGVALILRMSRIEV